MLIKSVRWAATLLIVAMSLIFAPSRAFGMPGAQRDDALAIARKEISRELGLDEAAVIIYRYVEADVDQDGVLELVVAGGDEMIGMSLLLDWIGGDPQIHLLGGSGEGFQTIVIRDVNQDGTLEIITLWRWGTGAFLAPYIISYDGSSFRYLLDEDPDPNLIRHYHQGALDFKDLDVDGTDELLVWESLWDGDCHWCLTSYDIFVFVWNDNSYQLDRKLTTEHKYDPGLITGQNANLFGMDPDWELNLLKIESARSELKQRQAEGSVSPDFVDDLISRGWQLRQRRLYEDAEAMADVALEAAQRLQEAEVADMLSVTALDLRGVSRRDLGKQKEADEDFQRSLDMLEVLYANSTVDKEAIKWNLVAIGIHRGVNLYQYDQLAGLKAFIDAATIAQELDDLVLRSIALSDLGSAYLVLRDFDNAQGYYERALSLDKELERPFGEMINLWGIGSVYFADGDIEQAILHFENALSIALELGENNKAADYYRDIGRSYYELGRFEEARQALEQSLLLSFSDNIREYDGLVYLYLGDLHFAQGDFQGAEAYYRKVLAAYGTEPMVSPFGTFWRANYGLAQVAKRQNDGLKALNYLETAIGIIENERKAVSIDDLSAQLLDDRSKLAVYSEAVALLSDMGRNEMAYIYSERSRARALLDQLANGSIDLRAGASSALLERERTLRAEIAVLRAHYDALRSRSVEEWDAEAMAGAEAKLAQRESDYDSLLTEIKIQSPEVASLVSMDVASLAEVQALLDAETTLIEYFVMQERTVVFMITRDTFDTVVVNVSHDELRQMITIFRDFASLNDAHPAELKQLYDWLIAPLEGKLTTPVVGIVPHGPLHYLPFAALTDGERFFGDDHVLFTLPSASTLRFIREKRKPQVTTALVLGNPTTDLPELRFAEQEARSIASLYGMQALVGADATESALWSAAGEAGILHLAAHGEYNPYNQLFSAIQLSGDGQNDGRLEVHEIYGLDLTQATDLVVLSACETHVGSVSAGDEVVGLNRAFIYAGTPTVIASLWNVDDQATAFLMEQFYAHLRADMNKGEALRQAQLDVRARYPHPYYWAAFVLTGDPGPARETPSVGPSSGSNRLLWVGVMGALFLFSVAGILSILMLGKTIGKRKLQNQLNLLLVDRKRWLSQPDTPERARALRQISHQLREMGRAKKSR